MEEVHLQPGELRQRMQAIADEVAAWPHVVKEIFGVKKRNCCRRHWIEDAGQDGRHTMHLMVCKQCGNKRCPKATHCDLKCTGSNAGGQAGSVFE